MLDTELPDIHWMSVNPAKRRAQRHLLGEVLGHSLRPDPIAVLCLPGKAAWDIDYFLHREDVEHVIGIERDEAIAAFLRGKYANEQRVKIVTASVSKYLLTTDDTFDVVYLDYCSPFSLSVIQDVEILLNRKVLAERGRCLISTHNAREAVSTQVAHRRLFDEIEDASPSGESWDEIDPDRRRCIALNALLHRHRVLPKRASRIAVGATSSWHRYSTPSGGSMLTGYFMVRTYEAGRSDMNAAKDAPDKWYVRGRASIKDVEQPRVLSSLVRCSRSMGRDLGSALIQRGIVHFYNANGHAPYRTQIDQIGCQGDRAWAALVRKEGLCPRKGATLEDVREELRRIHKRVGVVRRSHLIRAKLLLCGGGVSHSIVGTTYGWTTQVFAQILDELSLPHDLRTATDIQWPVDVKEWILHLESGKPQKASRHYSRMRRRGVQQHEDAVLELRRIEARYPE